MKKPGDDADENDDLRPEYDLSKLEGGVRGKYARQRLEETNLVRLDPDVAQAFPNEQAVNEALRLLMKVARRQLVPSH
jgi:hypothetical protein